MKGPDGASLGDSFGSNAAELDVRVPSTGTYTVLVSSQTFLSSSNNQVGPGSYVLTVAKTPGPYNESADDEATSMEFRRMLSRFIQVGDLDPWTFQAAANDSI